MESLRYASKNTALFLLQYPLVNHGPADQSPATCTNMWDWRKAGNFAAQNMREVRSRNAQIFGGGFHVHDFPIPYRLLAGRAALSRLRRLHYMVPLFRRRCKPIASAGETSCG